MHRLVFALVLLNGCATWSSAARQTDQVFAIQSGNAHTSFETAAGGAVWSEYHGGFNPSGPPWLREVAPAIAACGQQPDDTLHVRVRVDRSWPFDVEVREATPGAEDCIAQLLSTQPLDRGLPDDASRYLAARVRAGSLSEPTAEQLDPRECVWRSHAVGPVHLGPVNLGGLEMEGNLQLDVGALTERVACETEVPVTRLHLRYAGHELASVRTSPEVPCVEDAVRTHLSDVHALEPLGPTIGDWEAVLCTVDLTL